MTTETRNIKKGAVDPDLPITPEGSVYHLACKREDLADNFIFVGDPDRVAVVAERFDKDSIIFNGRHREIVICTGKYKGVPVTVLSSGMGTDNTEIIVNEIHVLKEYDVKKGEWDKDGASKAKNIKIIRVGTCGCPAADLKVGTLAISTYGIGMDNTCRYYTIPRDAEIDALTKLADEKIFNKVGGCYTTKAHDDIINALKKASEELKSKRVYAAGITCSGSGFYGNQGRVVGRFRGKVTFPNLVDMLGNLRFKAPNSNTEDKVVNIEMENSALCCLSSILGFRAGTVCAIIAKRAGDVLEFATPEEMKNTLEDAITTGLEALIKLN